MYQIEKLCSFIESMGNEDLQEPKRSQNYHRERFKHRAHTQVASLVVCSKYKEMYGKILKSLKSLAIVKLYRGMSKLKVEINVNLPQLMCIVVSVALNCLRWLLLTYSITPWTQNPPNRSNSPFRATETTIHNNWGRITFISTFNLDIQFLDIILR